MYEIYHLHAEPFRLSPDPAFCYEHKHFRSGHAYMKYALAQGDGVCIVTGHPGTGKTMLVEYFLRELDRSTLLEATLFNTQIEGDDLLRMVGFGFGIDLRNLDRATMLHNLREYLCTKRRCGKRALLIIDEAQKLSTTALDQLRMLTNLKDAAKPLLQLFLVGEKQLIDMISTPEMEPLHQRIVAAADLEPLLIDESSAYIQHRLRCAGWPGGQLFSKEAVVLIYRFSAGYPRLINKICARALLDGSLEQRLRLEAEDIFNTLVQMQDEHLMPGKDIWKAGVAAGWQDMVNVGFKSSDWISHLTQEEQAFLEQPDISLQPEAPPKPVSQPGSAPIIAYARELPQDLLAPPLHLEMAPFVPAVTAHRYAATGDAVSQDFAYMQMSGKLGHHTGWNNPWVGVAMTAVLLLIMFGAINDRSTYTGDGSTAALVQMAVYQEVEPDVGETTVSKQDMGGQAMDTEIEPPAGEIHLAATGNSVAEKTEEYKPAAITSVDDKVEALLVLAEADFQKNRLSVPAGSNASNYFSQVLALDPDNEIAQQGMQRIVVRYRGMAQRALQREDFPKSQMLAARGLRIDPGNSRLLRLQETARSHENEIRVAKRLAGASSSPPKNIEVGDNNQVQKGFWGSLKKIFTAPPSSEVSTRYFGDDDH